MDAVGMVQLASLEALSKAQSDAELKYQAKALNAVLRIGSDASVFDFVFVGDGVSEVRAAAGEAAVSKLGNDEFWTTALQLRDGGQVPGYESLTMAQTSGLKTTGDFLGVIAPYQAALQRLFLFFLENRPLARRPFVETFRDTDTAVGRYILVKANGAEARMYYGEAGTGKIPLLCQATAGADSRQYRYMLADPEMQRRFRVIAYDLPYHGRFLPPSGVRWWQQPYVPDVHYLMNYVVALVDALKLVGMSNQWYWSTRVIRLPLLGTGY